MRRIRNRRRNKQKQILILSTLVLFSILTIGYAAFQTNISLTAKGNVSPSATYTVNDLKSLVTTVGDGLYEDADEQGRYVFKGGNPNNYLTLNGETWRIMSIESDNTLKIIREDSIGGIVFDPGRATAIAGITESDSDVGTRYSTTSTDLCYYDYYNNGCKVWGSKDTMRNSAGVLLKDTSGGAKIQRVLTNSTTYNLPNDEAYLNVYLNGGTYAGVNVTGWYQTWSNNLDSDIESYIEDDHLWNVGLVSSDTSGQLTATDIAQEKALTWKGRVGLMTASEYVRASTNPECTGAYAYRNTSACHNNGASHNYLRKPTTQWTVSPDSVWPPDYVWTATSAYMSNNGAISTTNGVRPVLYLSPNTILKGVGTSGSEFQIANTEPNPNSGSSQGGSGGNENIATLNINVPYIQHFNNSCSTLPENYDKFSYAIEPLDGNAQPFENASNGIYYFNIKGDKSGTLPLSLTTNTNEEREYIYRVSIYDTPKSTGLIYPTEVYYLHIIFVNNNHLTGGANEIICHDDDYTVYYTLSEDKTGNDYVTSLEFTASYSCQTPATPTPTPTPTP